MPNSSEKPNEIEDLFKREVYEVIQPYRSNSEIFNKQDFDVRIFFDGNKKIALIRRAEKD